MNKFRPLTKKEKNDLKQILINTINDFADDEIEYSRKDGRYVTMDGFDDFGINDAYAEYDKYLQKLFNTNESDIWSYYEDEIEEIENSQDVANAWSKVDAKIDTWNKMKGGRVTVRKHHKKSSCVPRLNVRNMF